MTATARTEATTLTTATATTGISRTPEPGLANLARLVGRAELAAFLNHYQGRDAYRRRLPEGLAGELFGWPRLNAALAEHRLSPPRLRLEMAGADASKGLFAERRTRKGRVLHDLDPAVLNQRLRQGATLILDAANEVSEPLQVLCAGLAAELRASCQANLYACWGATQGFDVHWDDHDVFVVQVEGRKRWALYGSTREAPTYRDQHGVHRRPSQPVEEIVLEPGDMLYLPRGYWHAAVGMGEPTLHLTIGVTRKSGSDFLHWLANNALQHAAARADLPLEQDDERLGARIAELLALAALEPPVELGRRYRRSVEANLPQRPKLSFPHIGDTEAEYAPAARVGLSDGPREILAADRAAAFVLRHRGVDYTVSDSLAEPLARLAGGEWLSFSDLEAGAAPAARPLLAGFVSEMAARGVFVVRS